MPTDDERREVARRLRGLDYSDLQESLICAYLDALGIKGYEDWVGIAHRLADLIEPSESGQNRDRNQDTVQKESPGVQMACECDREALLALADEMYGRLDEYDAGLHGGIYMANEMRKYARRIREACGEMVA